MAKDETGWLIERHDERLAYFSLQISPMGSWEYDAKYGLRFARKVDAENYAKSRGLPEGDYALFYREHTWCAPRSPEHQAFMEHVGRKYPHLREKEPEDD